MLKQEMVSYVIIIDAAHTTKTTTNKVKTPDVMCTNLHTVDNVGHGSSLE